MAKLRVGVLMGGRSIEKEVSFNSGRTVCDHLDTQRYEIIPIYQTTDGTLYILPWHFLHRGKTTDFEHRLAKEAQHIIWDELNTHIDFAYIAMHGRYAEDGILQATLELFKIPYLGSSRFASALCMDKHKIKLILSAQGIATPKSISIYPSDIVSLSLSQLKEQLLHANIKGPWIIKPHNEGSSLGICVVHEEDQLLAAIQQAAYIHPAKAQEVLVEQFIDGMEFSCIVLEDYKQGTYLPLPPTEIVPEEGSALFDYEQKYMPGRAMKYTPARCSQKVLEKIQSTCVKIMQILGIKTIARIDGFVTSDGTIVIVDPNSSSGMAPSSFVFREAAEINMSHSQMINHLIETDLHHYGILDRIEKDEQKERARMNAVEKIRVAVIMGGPSHEREISLESGRNVTYKLSPHKYEISPIFMDNKNQLYRINQVQLVKNSTAEISESLDESQRIHWNNLKEQFDFVFIALHGAPGEDGTVQGMLEMLSIPYNGSSVFASALCMDKAKTAEFLRAAGFETPLQRMINQDEWHQNSNAIIEHITQQIAPPFIVKPHDDGCSVMVMKAQDKEKLANAIKTIFKKHPSGVLVEQLITGMELTVGVLGNDTPESLVPSQAVSAGDILSIEEKFLPGAGENQTPAPLPHAALDLVEKTMQAVYKAVGCKGYARIDCFYQSAEQSPTGAERVVTLEINSLPGLTPATCIFHQAAERGMRPMEFLDRIIELGFQEHRSQIAPIKQSEKRTIEKTV